MFKMFFYSALLLLFCSAYADESIKQMAVDIDNIIYQKLESIKQPKRKSIDDYTFARRLYLDTMGRIPTLPELEQFINNNSKNKRSELINSLLASRGHQSHMYNYWADLLRVKNIGDKLMYAGNLAEGIKSALRENRPYDQFVRDIVASEGELYKPGNGLVGYKAREEMQLDRLANTIKTFTGLAIECAQCHDHPFDDWTQKEFYKMAAFTSDIRLHVNPPKDIEKKKYAKIRAELKKESFDKWIVYREALRMKYAHIIGSGTGYMRLPHDYQYDDGKPFDVMSAKPMFGVAPTMNSKTPLEKLQKDKKNRYIGEDAGTQRQFAEWITSRENPLFTKATVNRLWAWVMGSELVGPVANLELGSEGKHPELTAKVVEVMKELNYDTRKFFAVLFKTKAYQSQALSLTSKKPEYLLDGPIMRRISSEQTWDSLLSLQNGAPDKYLPTKFHYDGFTLIYDKTADWTGEDFKKYSRELGLGRREFYEAVHKEALDVNEDIGPHNELRASESRIFATKYQLNLSYLEVAGLFGASDRNLIDNANKEPNIPQILYMMNGSPEDQLISGKSYLKKALAQVQGLQKYERLWLAVLNRPMNKQELKFVASLKEDPKAVNNMLWALLNSNEFRFVR